MVEPFNQGDLGGLCGVYSIINAARLVSGFDKDESEKLFTDMMVYLGDAQLVADGIGIQAIGRLLRDVANSKIKFRAMPFRNYKDAPLSEVWFVLNEFLSEPNRAAIIWVGWADNPSGHWTTVSKATPERLLLVDSVDFRQLLKVRCTVKIPTITRTHSLYPPCIYLCSNTPIR